jgi:hypothetical protein
MACPVCNASGTKPCFALDHRPLPSHHPERVVQETEATPMAEAAEARALLTRLVTDMTLVAPGARP